MCTLNIQRPHTGQQWIKWSILQMFLFTFVVNVSQDEVAVIHYSSSTLHEKTETNNVSQYLQTSPVFRSNLHSLLLKTETGHKYILLFYFFEDYNCLKLLNTLVTVLANVTEEILHLSGTIFWINTDLVCWRVFTAAGWRIWQSK